MRNSKNKNLIITTPNTSNSNCFTSILQRFTCGGNLPSPTPSDGNHHHHIFPIFRTNGCIHPNPNELPESEPGSTSSHTLDHPRQPGLVARLMGLESMPSCPNLGFSSQDSILNLRSKSLNSLHLYIFPDTFLDHVSPSPTPQLLYDQRRKPCHRRVQTSSSILCLDPLPVKEKLEADSVMEKPERRRRNGELSKRKKVVGVNEMNMNKINGKKGLNASKCKVSEDHRTRKCRSLKKDDPMKEKSHDSKRREIKYTRLRKENRVCSETKNGATKSSPLTQTSKDCSSLPRRRSSRKIIMEKHDETYQGLFQCHDSEENSMSFRGKKLRSRSRTRTRTDMEDWLEMMDQVCRIVEECVREDVWDEFDENVKEFGVDFAGQMLDVLIDQFLHELIG